MYVQTKKLAAISLFLLFSSIVLTGCGGASSDEGSPTTPSSTANKPDVSSIATSSNALSSITPSSVASSTSSNSSSLSSKESSSTQSYTRISRSSNSSVAVDDGSRDTTPPEATSLQLYRLSETSITVIWDDAIDNAGINHYKITRNGVVIATADISSHILVDQNLAADTEYNYVITAVDFSGNATASPPLTVRTLATFNGASSASSMSKSSSSSTPSSSSNSANASSQSSSGTQQIFTITWNHPTTREDGAFLDPDEIGGYEIRYRKASDSRYTYIILNGNRANAYTHKGDKNTEFEIAAFDTNGVYGHFTKISY
ncbi:MAG: fibronectin type III domain-containing protein [Cellvibrio sp.]|uniref:fibronectin type III domain-containing protein n=1 Tax=Cellvibrio sp. TaxID=1965322 RepID=UPI0031A62DF5